MFVIIILGKMIKDDMEHTGYTNMHSTYLLQLTHLLFDGFWGLL